MLNSFGMIVLLLNVADLYAAIVAISNLKNIVSKPYNRYTGVFYRALAMERWRESQIRVGALIGMIMFVGVFSNSLFHRPWTEWLVLIPIFGIACFRVFIHFRLRNCVQMSNQYWLDRGEAEAAKKKLETQGARR